MINAGKCPKCEATITYVRIEGVDVKDSGRSAWKGITYCCPSCSTVLSVSIDPIAIKSDIVAELKKGRF